MAKFLEARGHVQKALEVAKDGDLRFDLAVQLDDVDAAVAIAEELASESRWKQLGEMALAGGRLPLAERCLEQSGDLSGQLLMFSATGNRAGMQVRLPSACSCFLPPATAPACRCACLLLARCLLQGTGALGERTTAT